MLPRATDLRLTPDCVLPSSCPDTKKLRDACYVEHGDETICAKFIEAHNKCLRDEGFNI